MSCADDTYPELVAGRVLDALEPGDDARLDAHLPTCADCRALLADLSATASSLAYGVDDAEPPPELLERIRAALPARSASEVIDLDALRERRRHRVRPSSRALTRLAAGVAAAAVLVAGGLTLQARSDRDATRARLASSESVLAHLQATGSYAVTLRSGGAAAGTAVVDGRTIDLVTRDLGRNDASSTQYVLWAAAPDGRMVAVTGFDVTTDGMTVVHATLPGTVGSPTVFGVSHEKGRSLPAVPSTVVLGVQSPDQA